MIRSSSAQPVSGRIVTVQVDASGGLQDAAHFDQPHGHEDQVRHHGLAVCQPGRLDDGSGGRVALGKLAMLERVYVIERPGILERRSGGLGADGSFVRAVGVERWVEIDEIDARGVHPEHDLPVVPGPDRAGREVWGSHHTAIIARPATNGLPKGC